MCAIVGIEANSPMVASMDSVMELALFTHEKYVNATCRKFKSDSFDWICKYLMI